MISLDAARDLVSRQGWLSFMPASFRNAVLDRSQLQVFNSEEVVFGAGDPAGGIYGLVSGGLRVSVAPNDRIPFFAHLFIPGSWTGESAAISGEPRMVSLVAVRETQTFYLPLPAVNEILRESPDAFRSFARLAHFHLATAVGAAGDLMIRDPVQRFIAVLLRLSGCRVATPPDRVPIDLGISEDDLAMMANVGRTKASAILRRLHRDGQVELTYRHVRVIAPDSLRAMLSE
jgi:CRP/FNR family cyclic AMP-dependent transcriptional regulator